MYKVSYQVCWGRISSIEEGKEISWLWGRIKREKGEGEAKPSSIDHIEAVGKNIKWGTGEGVGNFREENQD